MGKPATAETSTALVPIGEAGVTYSLDNWPEDKFNRLIPVQQIWMPGDLFVPVVNPVVMDPADRDGKSLDHYSSKDVPPGRRALTARGLSKVANAASISFYDEHRMDDGSDPDVMAVSVEARMTLPTTAVIRVLGTQLIDIRTWFGPSTSALEIAKFRKQFYANVATRAKNRAVRGILSLKSSYTDAEIARPFAAVTFAPNTNHPEVRARLLDAMAPAVAQLYGPAAAPQLQAGQVVTLAEAPEDDAMIEGEARDAGPEPSWFGGASDDGQAAAVAPLAQVLRDSAEASGMKGPATEPQKAALQEILKPLGLPAVAAGFAAAFEVELDSITAAQAQAVVNAARGDDDFGARWAAMVAGKAAA